MKSIPTSRRRFLHLAAGAGAVSGGLLQAGGTALASAAPAAQAVAGDGQIRVEFDSVLRMRVLRLRPAPLGGDISLSVWSNPDTLTVKGGARLEAFDLHEQRTTAITDAALGRGTRLTLRGVAGSIEKISEVELFERHTGFALFRVAYRNLSSDPISIRSWSQAQLQVPASAAVPAFWSFCGSTHPDRRDWVQPVKPGFSQENFMGMAASDYGGGTPIVDLWRADAGVAIGHLETVPQLVSLPLRCTERGATLAIVANVSRTLNPGATFVTPQTFVAVHSGDYFAVLDGYRRIMGARGISSPAPPAAAYEPIWCAWGYERNCTVKLIEDTLPKVQDLGLRWAVIDDGWQSNVGDWNLNRTKYPGGEPDMLRLVANIRARALKPRLWWAPLAVAPGSDVLHDHSDMLLLDKDGAVQNISWWNCFYLCPAYQGTIDYTLGLVRRFMGEWGFAGLKIDGQHLNSVAPCYNPAHRHARPEESVEKLQDLYLAIYRTALQIDPGAVVELCPCGTSYSFFNFRSFNQAPASDPESSWQVRHKGKTLKALMGPSAAFAGDHVELSAGGRDFASTVGIGGIISTKFTWPEDPKPRDSFLLTPPKEALWRKWITLYNERQLPEGRYRGELYDIGFDRPETHVVEKSGRLYYAFYAKQFTGPVALRGLSAARYRIRDYFHGTQLGEVSAAHNTVAVNFEDFLVIEAIPV
jgi:alpha-galactosidase